MGINAMHRLTVYLPPVSFPPSIQLKKNQLTNLSIVYFIFLFQTIFHKLIP